MTEKNFESPGKDSNILTNNNVSPILNISHSETNFYVDIPQQFNPIPRRILIKANSTNNSTWDDNSNLITINNYNQQMLEKNSESSNIVSNRSNLKFKIELQYTSKNENEAKQIKKKDYSKVPKALNALLKTYYEVRQSKFLGKKRFLEEKEKKIELDQSINYKKVEFSFDPEKIKSFDNFLQNSKKFSKKQIKFFKERLSFFPDKQEELKENLLIDVNSDSHNSLDRIVNHFDKSLRIEYAQTLSFQKKFQEEYFPIKMQKENENAAVSKTHFIKKKQTPLNIKRHCGVSYVIPSESKQLNVSDRYK